MIPAPHLPEIRELWQAALKARREYRLHPIAACLTEGCFNLPRATRTCQGHLRAAAVEKEGRK